MPYAKSIAVIVEGQSEEESVRTLLSRILERDGVYDVGVHRPFRVKRNRFTREGEVERSVIQMLRDRGPSHAVLILVDADDDCPVGLAENILVRACSQTSIPCFVVVPVLEFEAWFLGAARSLNGFRGLVAEQVDDPESIRGAKGRLTRMLPRALPYDEVDDQPRLAARMSLEEAEGACASFRRLVRVVRAVALLPG